MAGVFEGFRPDMRVRSVMEIDLADLRKRGYIGLMLDLDNTLLPWKDLNIPIESKAWLETSKKLGMKPCIISNTHHPNRLMKIADQLQIPAIGCALKPDKRGFHRAAEIVGCEIDQTVVVGDQLLTDILGGNRAGAYTILVNPMHNREFLGTKVSRMIERLIFAVLREPRRV